MSGHGHSHGGGGCDHSDELPENVKGDEFSLYLKIDLERLQCLNEETEGSGKTVFKPWDKRLDTTDVSLQYSGISPTITCEPFKPFTTQLVCLANKPVLTNTGLATRVTRLCTILDLSNINLVTTL